jgi:ferredoxin
MAKHPRVTVDETRCVGSGDCALITPTAFEVNEEKGFASVLPGAAQTDPAQLERAAHSCPTGAISTRT